MPAFFEVTYRVSQPPGGIEAFAEAILLEQTFETPDEVVRRYPSLTARRGRVLSIEADGADHLVRLALPDDVASENPAQFLNAAFGNASLHRGVRFEDVEVTPAIEQMLGGPRFGVEGVRDHIGVHDRPLTCSAIKPVGLSLEELVTLCRRLAIGGIDIIKDDHYLADQARAPFRERLKACLDVTREVAARDGRTVWFVPNVTGTPDEMLRAIDSIHEEGAPAIMMAPYLSGLPTFHWLTGRAEVPVFAHPSHSSSATIAPGLVWGKLPRLFGADASIFANSGGRFALGIDEGRMIAAMVSTPIGKIRRCFSVPAGGLSLDSVADVIRFYGNDTILLVGGSLLRSNDLASATRQFVDSVASAALLVK
jgi:ribulose-bisphosphate carboxylase large chain